MLRDHPVARPAAEPSVLTQMFPPRHPPVTAHHVYQKNPTVGNRPPAPVEETLGRDGGGESVKQGHVKATAVRQLKNTCSGHALGYHPAVEMNDVLSQAATWGP